VLAAIARNAIAVVAMQCIRGSPVTMMSAIRVGVLGIAGAVMTKFVTLNATVSSAAIPISLIIASHQAPFTWTACIPHMGHRLEETR